METIEILKNNGLFGGLEEGQLKTLADLAKQKKVKKKTFIIKEGENSNEMYLIKKGKVEVMLNNNDGKELILSTLLEGESFGELSLLDNKPRSANVVSLEDCVLLTINQVDFYEFLRNNSKAAIEVIKYLCRQLRLTNSIAHSYALMDVYERLRKYLYSVAEREPGGRLMIRAPLTHKEIAVNICTGREVVSRMLRGLEKDGYLTVKNKRITILKKLPSAL